MDAAPGHIRAMMQELVKDNGFFILIPQPGGSRVMKHGIIKMHWKWSGGANNWMGMTIDQERGVAYIPLGSASMDFYGGKRTGCQFICRLYVSPDAATGKKLWHFQYIHHDT